MGSKLTITEHIRKATGRAMLTQAPWYTGADLTPGFKGDGNGNTTLLSTNQYVNLATVNGSRRGQLVIIIDGSRTAGKHYTEQVKSARLAIKKVKNEQNSPNRDLVTVEIIMINTATATGIWQLLPCTPIMEINEDASDFLPNFVILPVDYNADRDDKHLINPPASEDGEVVIHGSSVGIGGFTPLWNGVLDALRRMADFSVVNTVKFRSTFLVLVYLGDGNNSDGTNGSIEQVNDAVQALVTLKVLIEEEDDACVSKFTMIAIHHGREDRYKKFEDDMSNAGFTVKTAGDQRLDPDTASDMIAEATITASTDYTSDKE